MNDPFEPLRAMEVDFPRLVGFYNRYGQDLVPSGIAMPSMRRRKFLVGDSAAWFMLLDMTKHADDDIAAAGMVHLGDSGTRMVAYIEMVLVRGDYRGRGLGERIMQQLHAWGVAHGAERFLLTSRKERVAARTLYERLGYRLVEGSDRHFFFDPPRPTEPE
jgi:ribosomal protein S18 acetylase RimI-like enzyme